MNVAEWCKQRLSLLNALKRKSPANADEPQQLRALLQEKVAKFYSSVIAGDNETANREFTQIEQLSKIRAISQESEPKAQKWYLPVALVAALLAVTVLASIKLERLNASFDLIVSAVQFSTTEKVPVIGRLRPAQLGISGLEKLNPPEGIIVSEGQSSAGDRPMKIFLTAEDPSIASNDITLEPVIPPIGTRVLIDYADRKFGYAFSFEPGEGKQTESKETLMLAASVRGIVKVVLPGLKGPQSINFGSAPKRFQFEGGQIPVGVAVDLSRPPSTDVYSQRIEKIKFETIEEFPGSARSMIIPRSTILSGNIYLDSLDGQKIELRPGEKVDFTSLNCRLDNLKFNEESISIKFHGTVADLRRGDALISRSLMPSFLQWLVSRQPLAVLWGSAISLFGILASVLRWYKGNE